MKTTFTFLFCTLYLLSLYSQQFDNSIVKSEQMRYSNSFVSGKINYPGDESIDIKYYKLDLRLIHTPNYLSGNVTVKAECINNLSSFFLDLKTTMTVDSVKSGSSSLSFVHSADHKLNVTLDRNYSSGEEIEVTVYYQGMPVPTGFGSIIYGTHNGLPAIYTLSEPYGANDWWPCKDTPADKADSSDVWITCHEDLYAVSNGNLIEIVNNPDQTKTYKWKNSYTIAQYLISFAIADYHIYHNYFKYTPTDSMPVIHYIYPETFPYVQTDLDKTVRMLEVYSDLFGLYPFINEKYGHAQFLGGGGMEHQTVSSMGAFNEGLVSHELAHQWFGDQITCRDWHHIWLNEGFATYATGLYYEVLNGSTAYHSYMDGIIPAAKFAEGSIYVQDISDPNYIFDGYRSYSKGAYVLHMLRGVVGDSVFFDILKTYVAHPSVSYGTAVTEDFQAIAESVYGNSLEYFFQQWIYGVKFPKYFFQWYYELNGNDYELHLSISQETNSVPQFFKMPVRIKINTASGDTTITVLNDQQYQNFIFTIDEEPIYVSFDPDNWILRDLTITSDVNDPVFNNEYSLEQNYPNPFNPSTKIKFQIPRSLNTFSAERFGELVTLKVYDILGNEVTTLVNEYKEAGNYEIEFSAGNTLSSGVYYYQLVSGNFISTKQMILLK